MVGPLRFVDRGSALSPGAVSGLVVLLFGVNWESSYDAVVLCLIFILIFNWREDLTLRILLSLHSSRFFLMRQLFGPVGPDLFAGLVIGSGSGRQTLQTHLNGTIGIFLCYILKPNNELLSYWQL